MAKHLDDVPGHEDTHSHGAGIADKHLGGLTENVVDEERNQCSSKHEGEHCIGIVVGTVHGDAEHKAEGDAEATGETIHTVNHVHGVNDAYASEDGEGYANPPREGLYTPKSVQAIDAGTIADDYAEDGEDFDDESVSRSEVDDIVNGTYVKHHAHSEDDGQNSVAVADTSSEQGAADNSEEHSNASHDRHRSLLEFAGVGIIDEILLFGDGEDLEIDPERHHHGDEGR